MDFTLALGELFTLVVYGHLILEQADIIELEDDVLDTVFDVLVRDFPPTRWICTASAAPPRLSSAGRCRRCASPSQTPSGSTPPGNRSSA